MRSFLESPDVCPIRRNVLRTESVVEKSIMIGSSKLEVGEKRGKAVNVVAPIALETFPAVATQNQVPPVSIHVFLLPLASIFFSFQDRRFTSCVFPELTAFHRQRPCESKRERTFSATCTCVWEQGRKLNVGERSQ
jgi:hypothetical protein